MAGLSVGERLQNLNRRIAEACSASGRDPGSVRLVAVSKFQDEKAIRAAYLCGQRDFAENYWQEARLKQEQLRDLEIKRLANRYCYATLFSCLSNPCLGMGVLDSFSHQSLSLLHRFFCIYWI